MREGNDYSLDAVLVESKKEGNRVRQVFLKYLGSIHENAIHHVSARIKFWEKAKQILSTSALEPEVRQSIMNMIQKKVVKPGKSEIKEFNKLVSARRAAKLAQRNHRDDI